MLLTVKLSGEVKEVKKKYKESFTLSKIVLSFQNFLKKFGMNNGRLSCRILGAGISICMKNITTVVCLSHVCICGITS